MNIKMKYIYINKASSCYFYHQLPIVVVLNISPDKHLNIAVMFCNSKMGCGFMSQTSFVNCNRRSFFFVLVYYTVTGLT